MPPVMKTKRYSVRILPRRGCKQICCNNILIRFYKIPAYSRNNFIFQCHKKNNTIFLTYPYSFLRTPIYIIPKTEI
jgi:hypothetical protein